MKHNAINWFELQASDLNRARAFYEAILDTNLWEVGGNGTHKMLMFPCDERAGGVSGAICSFSTCQPGEGGTMVYLNVDGELDAVLARVVPAGGRICMDRTAIPPHGFIGVIVDSEGNNVGLHSRDE